jgi:hypothetical protein
MKDRGWCQNDFNVQGQRDWAAGRGAARDEVGVGLEGVGLVVGHCPAPPKGAAGHPLHIAYVPAPNHRGI